MMNDNEVTFQRALEECRAPRRPVPLPDDVSDEQLCDLALKFWLGRLGSDESRTFLNAGTSVDWFLDYVEHVGEALADGGFIELDREEAPQVLQFRPRGGRLVAPAMGLAAASGTGGSSVELLKEGGFRLSCAVADRKLQFLLTRAGPPEAAVGNATVVLRLEREGGDAKELVGEWHCELDPHGQGTIVLEQRLPEPAADEQYVFAVNLPSPDELDE